MKKSLVISSTFSVFLICLLGNPVTVRGVADSLITYCALMLMFTGPFKWAIEVCKEYNHKDNEEDRHARRIG